MDLSNGVGESRVDSISTLRARRTRLTPEQKQRLEEAFVQCPKPNVQQRNVLAESVNLTPIQVQTWFSNRRTRAKRESVENELRENSLNNSNEHGLQMQAADSSTANAYPVPSEQLLDISMPEGPLDTDAIKNVVNNPNVQFLPMSFEAAARAMEELEILAKAGEPLWLKSITDGRDFLDEFHYGSAFNENEYIRRPNILRESSRYSGVVTMDALALANISMNPNKWMQCFPAIVIDAKTIGILNACKEGNPDGAIHLMRHTLQVLSPLVPVREIYFLRYCRKIRSRLWGIVDVTCGEEMTGVRKLPSGFLIEGVSKFGCSQVTWIEHVEVEGAFDIPNLFKDHISESIAFGARQWISSLQRTSARIDFSPIAGPLIPLDPVNEAISTRKGRDNLLKLSETMVNDFFSSINRWGDETWNIVDMSNETVIRSRSKSSNGSTRLEDVAFCAVTSFWVPLSPKAVFDCLRNEYMRPQWDALFINHSVKEIANIKSASENGNYVTVFEDNDDKNNIRLILQESSTDTSGTSVIVHSPVHMDTIHDLKTAEVHHGIDFLSSGIAIIPVRDYGICEASSSSRQGAGSLVTLGFHVLFNDLGVETLGLAAVEKVQCLMGTSVLHLKGMMENSSNHTK